MKEIVLVLQTHERGATGDRAQMKNQTVLQQVARGRRQPSGAQHGSIREENPFSLFLYFNIRSSGKIGFGVQSMKPRYAVGLNCVN